MPIPTTETEGAMSLLQHLDELRSRLLRTVIAFLGGLHHWWPKMFGKLYSELWGRVGCLFVFLGFNMTFFSQFMLGTKGMPRRYATYDQLSEALAFSDQVFSVGINPMKGFGAINTVTEPFSQVASEAGWMGVRQADVFVEMKTGDLLPIDVALRQFT